MNECGTKSEKIYIGFDISEKTIDALSIFGTATSSGSSKIDNGQKSIKKVLPMFEMPERERKPVRNVIISCNQEILFHPDGFFLLFSRGGNDKTECMDMDSREGGCLQ